MTETALLIALIAIIAIASIKALGSGSGSFRAVACLATGALKGEEPVYDPDTGHCVVDSGFGPVLTIF